MTILQAVCLGVAACVLVGFGLIVTGVAILAGAAWALITAGILTTVGAVSTGRVLLSEPPTLEPKP